MHNSEEQQGLGSDLFEEVTVANVTDLRGMRRNCALTISFRHADLSVPISFGTFYVAASPGRVLEAFETHIPALLRDLETGVSEEGRAALSLADFLGSLFGEGVVVEGVVSDSEVGG